MSHVVLLPVKPPAWGKSRLLGLGEHDRRALAEAFALDTLAACLAARSVDAVLVVTDDAQLAGRVTSLGASAIPDGTTWGMNEALRLAAADAHRRWPERRPVALCADLPALHPDDLDAALADLPAIPAFVADAAGTGTSLYTAVTEEFAPEFGPDSRLAHRDAGAHEIPGDLSSLRRDVDDEADLRQAIALGLGPATRAVIETISFR